MLKVFDILDKSLNISNGSAQDKSCKKGYQVSNHTKKLWRWGTGDIL